MRKGNMPIERIKQEAAAMGVVPELYWLMTFNVLYDDLRRCIAALNRGPTIDDIQALDLPIDRIREEMLVLRTLFEDRR